MPTQHPTATATAAANDDNDDDEFVLCKDANGVAPSTGDVRGNNDADASTSTASRARKGMGAIARVVLDDARVRLRASMCDAAIGGTIIVWCYRARVQDVSCCLAVWYRTK